MLFDLGYLKNQSELFLHHKGLLITIYITTVAYVGKQRDQTDDPDGDESVGWCRMDAPTYTPDEAAPQADGSHFEEKLSVG